jgi:hypothetical protein
MPMKKINSDVMARNALSVEKLEWMYERIMKSFTKWPHCWTLHRMLACKWKSTSHIVQVVQLYRGARTQQPQDSRSKASWDIFANGNLWLSPKHLHERHN